MALTSVDYTRSRSGATAPRGRAKRRRGRGRATGLSNISPRPGSLAIVQKAMRGALVRSRTDPTDRPGWRFTGPLARRGVSLPPSIMPSTPSHRRRRVDLHRHPPSALQRDQMDRPMLLPERAAQMRRDTGRSEIRSVPRVTRVRSGALVVPPASATGDCATLVPDEPDHREGVLAGRLTR